MDAPDPAKGYHFFFGKGNFNKSQYLRRQRSCHSEQSSDSSNIHVGFTIDYEEMRESEIRKHQLMLEREREQWYKQRRLEKEEELA